MTRGRVAQPKNYNLSGGINRNAANLDLPEGQFRDSTNLVPRSPQGAEAIRGDTAVSSVVSVPDTADDLVVYYPTEGSTAEYIYRDPTYHGIKKANGTGTTIVALADISDDSLPLHSLTTYKGSLVIAEQGETLKMYDGNVSVAQTVDGAIAGNKLTVDAATWEDSGGGGGVAPAYSLRGFAITISGVAYQITAHTASTSVLYIDTELTATSFTAATIAAGPQVLVQAPKAGLACEFRGCLWAIGDPEAETAPPIRVPMYGTAVPLPDTEIDSGSGATTINSGAYSHGSLVLADSWKLTTIPAETWPIEAHVGRVCVISNGYYGIVDSDADELWFTKQPPLGTTNIDWTIEDKPLVVVPSGAYTFTVGGATPTTVLSAVTLNSQSGDFVANTIYYWTATWSGATCTLSLYNDAAHANLLSQGYSSAGVISLTEQNASGITASITVTAGGSNDTSADNTITVTQADIDFGDVPAFGKSGQIAFRVHNRGSAAARAVAGRIRGVDWRIVDAPNFPITIPPGGTIAIKVEFQPQSKGYKRSSLLIDHDVDGQGTLVAPVVGHATTRQVVASPSVVDFGEWPIGSVSPEVAVSITNTLADSITMAWPTTVAAPFTTTETLAALVVPPSEAITFHAKYSPTTAGTHTDDMTFTRTVAGKPNRLFKSAPGDPYTWNRDLDWIDIDDSKGFAGLPKALACYNDTLIVFLEAEWVTVVQGGVAEFRRSSITLGKGRGAMNQQSVCVGQGSMWIASKQGIFRITGTDVEEISIPISDYVAAVHENDFPEVRCCLYKDWFWFYAPLTSNGTTAWYLDPPNANSPPGLVGSSVWIYHKDWKSWWRLSRKVKAGATLRGKDDKEQWIAIPAGTAAITGSGAMVSGVLTPSPAISPAWTTNQWTGITVTIGSGVGAKVISSNTGTTITVASPPADATYTFTFSAETLQIVDNDPAGTPAWTLRTGHIGYNSPSIMKFLHGVTVHGDDPTMLSQSAGVTAAMDTGISRILMAEHDWTEVVLFSGVGTLASGTLTLSTHDATAAQWVADQWNDDKYKCEIGTTTYDISDTTTSQLVLATYPADGVYSFNILGPNAAFSQPQVFYAPPECFGGSFQLTFAGTKASAGQGQLFGYTVDFSSMEPRVGTPGRTT